MKKRMKKMKNNTWEQNNTLKKYLESNEITWDYIDNELPITSDEDGDESSFLIKSKQQLDKIVSFLEKEGYENVPGEIYSQLDLDRALEEYRIEKGYNYRKVEGNSEFYGKYDYILLIGAGYQEGYYFYDEEEYEEDEE